MSLLAHLFLRAARMSGGVIPAMLAILPGIGFAAAVSGQGSWETTLLARDLDANPATIEAYYDTQLGITWLADSNPAGTFVTWADADGWASSLNIGGVTGWRLPAAQPVNGSTLNGVNSNTGQSDIAYNISAPGTLYAGSHASELAFMFYNTLGNRSHYDTAIGMPIIVNDPCATPDQCLTNTGPFLNLTSAHTGYTSGQISTGLAAGFWFWSGRQVVQQTVAIGGIAWAVHPGDIGAAIVPIPAAIGLFGSTLGLLGFLGRRQEK